MPQITQFEKHSFLQATTLPILQDVQQASTDPVHIKIDADHVPTNTSEKRNYMNDVDGGYAWVIVISSFLIHFINFGFLNAYGVFLKFYLDGPFNGKMDTFVGSFIGTLSNSVLTMMGLVSGQLADKIGYRTTLAIGSVILCLGQLLASFSTEVWHLFLTQGVLLGIGSSMTFFPAISAPAFWFQKKKGLALGICVSGSGIGGLIWSPIIQVMFDTIGFRWCLRVCSLISAVFMPVAWLLMKVKPIPASQPKQPINTKLILNPRFLSLFWAGLVSSLSFYVPFYLLPQYANAKGLSPSQSSILVGLISGGSALGHIILGSLADKIGRINMAWLGIFVAGFICLVCWVFANSFGVLIVFTIIYGFSSGVFLSISPALTSDIFYMYNVASVNGLLYVSTSIPNLVGTPIAAIILKNNTFNQVPNFLPVILYAGILPIVASLGLISLKWLVTKNLLVRA